MSQHDHSLSQAHADAHDDHQDMAHHGSLKGYLIGFVLSVILTAIPFWLVMSGGIGSSQLTAVIIMVFAAAQILVHMHYFLHLDTRSEGGWNFLALMFTVVFIVIIIAGSLWVMFHLNANMMVGMDGEFGQIR